MCATSINHESCFSQLRPLSSLGGLGSSLFFSCNFELVMAGLVESFLSWSVHSRPQSVNSLPELVGLVRFDSVSMDTEARVPFRKRAEFVLELIRVFEGIVNEVVFESILLGHGDAVGDLGADERWQFAGQEPHVGGRQGEP